MQLQDGTTLSWCPKCGHEMRDHARVPLGQLGICDCCMRVVRYTGGPWALVAEPEKMRPAELREYNKLDDLAQRLRLQRAGQAAPMHPDRQPTQGHTRPVTGPRTGAGPRFSAPGLLRR